MGRTGVEGTLLTEAKHINLSLHFLEQVIVALSDKSRSHIPYRNSMMTSVLRDRFVFLSASTAPTVTSLSLSQSRWELYDLHDCHLLCGEEEY